MKKFKEFLQESIEDKGILKAVFMAGSPGSGKSYVIKKISSGVISPRIVNTDKFTEALGLELPWIKVKDKVKKLTIDQFALYINSLLPLWVDGTSSSLASTSRRAGILQSLGYDTALVFINTSLETALERASKRERKVSPDFIKKAYAKIQKVKKNLFRIFPRHQEIRNDDGELTTDVILNAFRKTLSFFNSSVNNPEGQEIISKLKANNEKYLVPLIFPDIDHIKRRLEGWYNR